MNLVNLNAGNSGGTGKYGIVPCWCSLGKWRNTRETAASTDCNQVDYVWNVMAHLQKPDFVFRRNVRVHLTLTLLTWRIWWAPNNASKWQMGFNSEFKGLKSAGASVQSTTGSRGVRISGSNAGYTMFRGSVKGTGYQLHSPVSPSLPLPCNTASHQISTGLYFWTQVRRSASGSIYQLVIKLWQYQDAMYDCERKNKRGEYTTAKRS
jgi:hypothetical protein